MAKFLKRNKESEESWQDWDDTAVDWDADGDVEADELAYEEAGYYEEGEYAEEAEYYEEGEYAEEAEYYEEGEYAEEAEYYEEGEYVEETAYYEDGEYESEDGTYVDMAVLADAAEIEAEDAEQYYEEDAYYEDVVYYEDDVVYGNGGHAGDRDSDGGVFAWFMRMGTMDRIMLGAGVCVILLLIITGIAFWSGSRKDATDAFASVGAEFEGIEVVGGQGLAALDDMLNAEPSTEAEPEIGKDYGEADYNKNVTVSLKTASVQKDLKIKFVNKSSEKLISNVPFTISVTAPNGKVETWSDDDMDGIIHKKSITPGKYELAVNELSGDKYAGYSVPSSAVSAEVRKDIAYKKVDVSDEVKKESEVNVATEEQVRNNDVESGLEDTVEWVESTQVTSTYIEVSKGKITDPATVAKSGSFMRMSKEATLDRTSAELVVGGDSLTLTATFSHPDDVVSEGWSSSDGSVAEVDGEGVVTPVSAGEATITFTVTTTEDGKEVTYKASCKVTVTDPLTNFAGKISVDSDSVTVTEGDYATVQTTLSGFDSGKTVAYSVSSEDEGVAEASVNDSGKITVTGVGAGQTYVIVSAKYKDNADMSAPTAKILVTVTAKGSLSIDKSSLTVLMGNKATIKITANEGATLSAKSSDTAVATVMMDGKSAVVTPVKTGTATITITAQTGDNKQTATCAVTVKANPQSDTTSKLKDNDGNQLYVQDGDKYREAVYADYYKDGMKFFKKGDVKYTGWQTIDGKVYYFDKHGKKVTGEQVIQGAKYTFDSDGVLQTGSAVMGIDVSKHNGNIDWNAVKKSGVSYVIIRCGYRGYTQGSLIIDSKFEQNIKGATSAGLKVGVYFFSQAVDEVEAVEEASFVLDAVKNYKISYPIFLDVEYSGAAGNKGRADGLSKSARTAVCKAFCETIRSGGYAAGVYANRIWLESMIDTGSLGAYKIWLAQYAATPTYTGRYDMWQYKCTGRVSGITGDVDMNLSYMGY